MNSQAMDVARLVAPLPYLVAAVYGNGRVETRLIATNEVLATAENITAMAKKLKDTYPNGFVLDVRYDPHM